MGEVMRNFKKSVLGTAVLSSLLVSGVSFADPNWNNGSQGQYQQTPTQSYDHRPERDQGRVQPGGDDRRDMRYSDKFQREQAEEYRHDVKEQDKFQQERAKEYRHDVKEQERFDRERAKEYRHDMKEQAKWEREYYRNLRPHERWHRGDRLPEAYRSHVIYINDWQARHLYAPPVGHRWVEVNGDYVLVAIATNVIANILLGH
jgi:Ni/Co efflux regulator RcnB